MRFSEVAGQAKLKNDINNMLENGVFPHATIFVGGEENSALPIVLSLASRLVSGVDEEGPTWNKASKMIHPDVHYSFPFTGSKETSDHYLEAWRTAILENPYLELKEWATIHAAENKQLNINAKECNSIIKKLGLKSFEGRAKVMIIWCAELLGREGNRLLKLIEEPTENTFIILVADQADRILGTILSRCQLFKLKPLSSIEMNKWLIDVMGLETVRAQNIAQLSQGSTRIAIELIKAGEVSADIAIGSAWLEVIKKGDFGDILDWCTAFSRIGREQQKIQISGIIGELRQVLTGNAKNFGESRSILKEITCDGQDIDTIAQLNDIFTGAISAIERNANSKIIMMAKSIEIWRIVNQKRTQKV